MRSNRLTYAGAIILLFLLSAVLVLGYLFLDGSALNILANPKQWLSNADTSYLSEVLATATGAILAVLGIAITVVAIVVELAANRYNHRISNLFIREPINIGVLSFFVVTAIVCYLAAATLSPTVPDAALPHAGFLLSVILVTISLLIVLPYFAFVISFVSPLNMIEKIRGLALTEIGKSAVDSASGDRQKVNEAIDELHDVVRSAMEQSDRVVAIAGVNALASIVADYQNIRSALDDRWFQIDEKIADDPDFISLEPLALQEIEEDSTWLEIKVLRQYLLLLSISSNQMRDIAYLIAINTRRIAVNSISTNAPLLKLSIRCFNSYLRSTINAGDMRTSYYLLNQYRLIAESITDEQAGSTVETIAHYLKVYGQLAFDMGQSFLLEVAAYDVMRLLEHSVDRKSSCVDALLRLLLDFDQEILKIEQEESLLGVRRAQIQAAVMLIQFGENERALMIARDLADEKDERLAAIRHQLQTEDQTQFWELTDRGVNFGYIEPGRRAHLEQLFAWIEEQRSGL